MAKIEESPSKRGDEGKYLVKYVNAQGLRRRKRFRTKQDARRFLEVVEAEKVLKNEPLSEKYAGERTRKNPTVREIYREFDEAVLAFHDKESAATTCRRLLKPLTVRFGDRRVSTLSGADIIAWKKEFLGKGRSKTSLAAYFHRFRAMLGWAVEAGLTGANPFKGIKVENGTAKEKEVLTDRQIVHLREKMPEEKPELAAYILLALETGMRVGEMYQLEWRRNVDLDNRKIILYESQTKTSRKRTVPLTETAYQLLRERKLKAAPGPYVLWHPLHATYITRDIKKATTRYGVPCTPHYLRTTWASRALKGQKVLLADGTEVYRRSNLKTVADVGGWSTKNGGIPRTLIAIYQKIEEEERQDCVDIASTENISSDTPTPCKKAQRSGSDLT